MEFSFCSSSILRKILARTGFQCTFLSLHDVRRKLFCTNLAYLQNILLIARDDVTVYLLVGRHLVSTFLSKTNNYHIQFYGYLPSISIGWQQGDIPLSYYISQLQILCIKDKSQNVSTLQLQWSEVCRFKKVVDIHMPTQTGYSPW